MVRRLKEREEEQERRRNVQAPRFSSNSESSIQHGYRAGVRTRYKDRRIELVCLLPVDCEGRYGNWSECSSTCGRGMQTKTFTITVAAAAGGVICTLFPSVFCFVCAFHLRTKQRATETDSPQFTIHSIGRPLQQTTHHPPPQRTTIFSFFFRDSASLQRTLLAQACCLPGPTILAFRFSFFSS